MPENKIKERTKKLPMSLLEKQCCNWYYVSSSKQYERINEFDDFLTLMKEQVRKLK